MATKQLRLVLIVMMWLVCMGVAMFATGPVSSLIGVPDPSPPPPPAAIPVALTQAEFRFRNDDGSETTATWHSPANTNVEFIPEVDNDIRLRVLIQSDGEDNQNFGLEYNLNGAGWVTVDEVSDVVRTVASANFADDDNTTQQLGSGTFVTGKMDEDATTDSIDFAGDDETEVEFMIRVLSADVEAGDLIDLRVVTGVGALDVYDEEPRITLGLYTPIETLIPVVPSRMPDQRGRRFTGGKGGHFTEVFEFWFADPEQVSVDRVQGDFPDVMRRKPWRPEGHFGYTEVPVPPDVVVHGWEFFTQRDVRREAARRFRHLFGTSVAGPTTVDFAVLSPLTLLGSLKVTPTFLIDDLEPVGTFEATFGTNLEGLD